jgi:ArsR family transcriptional regulator
MEDINFDKKFLEENSEIFKALGHPSRLCILYNLIDREEGTVSEMQHCLNEPQSTISQHIAKLRNTGIIKGERNGTEINYRVVNMDVRKILKIIRKERMENGE